MSFRNAWDTIWAHVLDNKNKLTTTGGLLLGIALTLTFKDLYPDLEHSFRRRLQHLRGLDAVRRLPGQTDHVRLEDHTGRQSSQLAPDEHDPRRTLNVDESRIVVGVEGLIGNTPLVKLKALSEATGCEILAKAEFLNGAGNSPKDRVALSMINHAEEEGLLVPDRGDTIFEGTVGSTGISLAAVCKARGYRAHMYVALRTHRSCTLSESCGLAACLTINQP